MKTNAQHQADYRSRRTTTNTGGDKRLNAWISIESSGALKRLARANGKTQRAMLEEIIIKAEERHVKNMDIDSQEESDYFVDV